MEYRFMPPATRFVERVHAGEVGRAVMLTIREHRFPFLVKVADWNRFSRNTPAGPWWRSAATSST